MSSIPLNMSLTGPLPTAPANLLADIISGATALSPGYTANLPGTLIEDISSTQVAGLSQADQFRVDAVNSITPYAANPALLAQLGVLLGLPQGIASNTSCFVVFSGSVGYYIPSGFLVSDGTNQYAVQDGGAIQTGGSTQPLYVVAVNSGSWAVPIGTITTVITSVPSPYTVTVTNQVAGVAGGSAETVESYRSRIMQAQISAAQGAPAFIKTQIGKVNGVISRLLSVQQTTTGWKVICGGGDPYAVAGAIYSSVLDLADIIGSATSSRNINVTITDSSDVYNIVYVNPPALTVGVACVWNTTMTNFTQQSQVNQLGQTAILNYINSVPVGVPLNIFALDAAFQNGVSSVLPIDYLTTLTFTITVNGTVVTPAAGTGLITTDSESYFTAAAADVTVTQ